MSEVFIARQPIFDRDMTIFGYKLLYSESSVLFLDNEDKTDASLIDNVLLVEYDSLTDGTLGFINFTKKLIIKEAPLLFPNKKTIIELQNKIKMDESLLSALKSLKDLGYIIALDGFKIDDFESYLPLIKYFDIAKIDFNMYPAEKQKKIIKEYSSKLVFLAKNVDSRSDFELAKEYGYKLFQGTFFSKPIEVKTKKIGFFSENLLFILKELHSEEPDFNVVTSAFERDVDLSYKLLRMVNSAYYGVKYHTDSLRLAILQLGKNELIRWINVLLIRGMTNPSNAELIKTSIIRGKMLAMLAIITGKRAQESNYFISGMFSSIDVMLNEPMKDVVEKLPLGDEVCKTLMGEPTPIRKALDAVIEYEKGNWNNMDEFLEANDIGQEAFISLYIDAIKWQKTF